MSENFNYCHVVGRTDVGRRRPANEDNMLDAITQNGLVSVVCDGMGGHVGGAMASKIAVTTIIEHLSSVYYDDPRVAIGESIEIANRAILQKTQEQPELNGMGSTCVLLIVRNGQVFIGHVGDSRIYLIRTNTIRQLTKDHSYVQMLVDCGQITKEEAEHHPRKNEITNALGLVNMTPPTVVNEPFNPEAGDCFLLCSDGLSGMVSDDKICRVISQQSKMNAQDRVDTLVDMANANGGVDNITVQLVEFSITPNAIATKPPFPMWAKAACGVVALLGLGLGLYFGLSNKNPEKNHDDIVSQVVDTIEYKEGERFVQFAFVDSLLDVNNANDSTIYQEKRTKLDPNSLEIYTTNLKTDNTKSWIAFTDKHPGDSIAFSFKSIDGTCYKYIMYINVTGTSGPKLDERIDDLMKDIKGKEPDDADRRRIPNPQAGNSTPNQGGNTPQVSPAPSAKIDTITVKCECKKIKHLILNYSGKTPELKLNGKEVTHIKGDVTKCGEIKEAQLVKCTEKDSWVVDSKKGQLKISPKDPKKNTPEFVIECKTKDNKDVVLLITVSIKNLN